MDSAKAGESAQESNSANNVGSTTIFSRSSSLARRKSRFSKAPPVSVNVIKPAPVVGAVRQVDSEVEKSKTTNDSGRMFRLEMVKEWSREKAKENQTSVGTEDATKRNSELGTSSHFPVRNLSERPKPPNLSLEQFLSHQIHATEVTGHIDSLPHMGTAKLGIEDLPLPADGEVQESEKEKFSQNGLYLVAANDQEESALRTMIVDKAQHPRFVINKSRPSSPTLMDRAFPSKPGSPNQDPRGSIMKEDIVNQFAQHMQTDSTVDRKMQPSFVIDDSPVWTRAPTRAAADDHVDHSSSTVAVFHPLETPKTVHPLETPKTDVSSTPIFAVTNSQSMKPAHSTTTATGLDKKPKGPTYVSKTSLDKLDTKELVKPMTKESKPVSVAALKLGKPGDDDRSLKIVPSQRYQTPKVDLENSKLFVVESSEPKQERSLVLSIPSFHEGDMQPPSAELIVPPPLNTMEPPATINRAMIPQKFILKKEKPQVPKIIHPAKVTPKFRLPDTAEQKVSSKPHPKKPVVEEALELNEDADPKKGPVEERKSFVEPPSQMKKAQSTVRATAEPDQQAQAFITAVAAPVQSVTLDLPDQKDEIDKKRAKQVAAHLQRKGIDVDSGMADSGGIRGYFDRNAKPIFVEKAKPRPTGKKPGGTATGKDLDDDLDEQSELIPVIPMEDIPSGMMSPSNMSIGTNQSKRSESSSKLGSASQQGNQLNNFLKDLDGDDLLMIDGLDERLREKLMSQLKVHMMVFHFVFVVCCSSIPVCPARVAHFCFFWIRVESKNGRFALAEENYEQDHHGGQNRSNGKSPTSFAHVHHATHSYSFFIFQLKMDMAVDIIEVQDRSFRVSVASAYGGAMFVALIKPNKNGKKPGKERFKLEKDIMAIPGYIEHQRVVVVKGGSQQVQFKDLHPNYPYWVYVSVDRSYAESVASKEDVDIKEITDTSAPVLLEMETAEENLEIEWARMTTDMRLTELRAAIRCELVQIKARFNFPILVIPDDNAFLHEDFIGFIDPSKTAPERDELKERLSREVVGFVEWWVGDEGFGSRARGDYHAYEALQMIVKGDPVRKYLNEGFIENEDVDALTRYALFALKESYDKFKCHRSLEPDVPHPLLQGKLSEDQRETGLKLFKSFRSWYKGGVVVEDYEAHHQQHAEQVAAGAGVNLTMEDSVSLSDGSDASIGDKISVPLTMQRLMERENALLDMIEAHDKCADLLKGLSRFYQYVLEKKFTEIMMVQDRGKLSEKVL